MNIIRSGVIEAGEVEINERELELRLGLPAGELNREGEYSVKLKKCREELLKETSIRYAFMILKTEVTDLKTCYLENFSVESSDLAKNLKGCCQAVLMGITLGPGVDRLLKRLRIVSESEHFMTDALASALAEAAADRLEEMVKSIIFSEADCSFRPRYSPGYGDCTIENQIALLGNLESEKTLGISLNDRCFMSPSKSITAIMGVCF